MYLYRRIFKGSTINLHRVTEVKRPFTKQSTQVNKVHMQRKELTLCGNVVHHHARMDGNSPLSMLSRDKTHTHTQTIMHPGVLHTLQSTSDV